MSHIDQCQYVREFYGVPARVGMHVTFDRRPGVIKGASNYVKVLLAGDKHPVNIHPTEKGLAYLNDDGSVAWPAPLPRAACAVKGQSAPHCICGHVLVGGETCGLASGTCEHQVWPAEEVQP